jgi:hypothetical protein
MRPAGNASLKDASAKCWRSRKPERSIWWLLRPSKTGPATMFHEVDMRFWLEHGEAAMRELASLGERSDGQIRQGRHD